MSLPEELSLHSGVVVIDLIGALLIVGYVLLALVTLARTGIVSKARLLVAEGAVLGLSFKTAGTLLKTLELHTWNQIFLFATVLTLRIGLKRLFTWERTRVESTISRRIEADGGQ